MTNEYATKVLKRIQYGTTYPVYEALDMAIEALSSSEPKTADSGSVDSEMPEVKTDRTTSGDLIRRQAVINAIENTDAKMSMEEWDEITGAVMGVPSAQTEQKWIPNWMHNGHEPEENDEYLVTWSGYLGDKITKPMLSICEYNDEWITEGIEEYGYNNVMIHAYMPLPEPYRGES